MTWVWIIAAAVVVAGLYFWMRSGKNKEEGGDMPVDTENQEQDMASAEDQQPAEPVEEEQTSAEEEQSSAAEETAEAPMEEPAPEQGASEEESTM